MPRERRIEYEGAIYHAMARGDRREEIVRDRADCERFVETLSEVVKMSGWLMYGWVLMNNHYHLLFKTPEANLVEGMKWFQNTWTRRFNSRHKLWGHLYGGRYKAKPVEEGSYLTRLLHYVHLNPIRAGLVKKRDGIESYPWSSLEDYVKPPRKRRDWVAVSRGLSHLECPDTVAGRRRFLAWTEGLVDWKDPASAGDALPDGQSLHATFRRGWYFGTESFREKLVGLLREGGQDREFSREKGKGYHGPQNRDRGIVEAERLVGIAERVLGLENGAWKEMAKGDVRKGLIGSLIRERALIDNGWLAERLHMGVRNSVSRIIRQAKEEMSSNRRLKRLANKIRREAA